MVVFLRENFVYLRCLRRRREPRKTWDPSTRSVGLLLFNLFGYDLEFFQDLWTENHCDRDVSSIPAASDDNPPDAALIMPGSNAYQRPSR